MTVEALRERAMALHHSGRLAEAERIYAEVLRQDPADWQVHLSLGAARFALRRPVEALASFDAALVLEPACIEAHHGRGMVLLRLQRLEEALASFEAALALAPRSAELLNSRGNALRRLQRHAEALASFDAALALAPQLAEAHNNRGLVLQVLGRTAEAAASYQRALQLQPQFAQAWNNLATVQCELGELDAALASGRRALELHPGMHGVHGNLGNVLRDQGLAAQALGEYEQALLEAPDAPLSHCNRGNALLDLGRLEEAVGSFERAIALDPQHAQAYFNKSVCLLLGGDFARGLPLYEWRKRLQGAPAAPAAAPVFDGTQDLAGRTLLLYAEQALGDTLQFCRYARLAQQRGAEVILSVQPALRALLASNGAAVRVTASDEAPPRCDYQCALLSLPLAFGTTLATVPATVPYLAAEPRRLDRWREWLGPRGFKVGIAWQGSRRRIDLGRSVPLAAFAALASVPGVRLISLQKGDGVEQLPDASSSMALELPGDEFDSGPQAFLDSAALMQHLDLVITCDTALAHLAGALGRAVWVALKSVPDWRWLLDRTDSPWYPSMRLFRQSRPGDWQGVFAAMRAQLTLLARDRIADPRYSADGGPSRSRLRRD
ncbi:MAG TPA: tetratricopeptide repeat-containing glycosyltransferase family protein [Steroidobacteraceae bacterium]|nr:tetratricopeptide repeat-containing glycosyltransferase family protein [Steroidobacteraceae bacterium]